jgi:hypothetical protein
MGDMVAFDQYNSPDFFLFKSSPSQSFPERMTSRASGRTLCPMSRFKDIDFLPLTS